MNMNEKKFDANFEKLTALSDYFKKETMSKTVFMEIMNELATILTDSTFTQEQERRIADLFGDVVHPYLDYTFEHAIIIEAEIAKKITTLGEFKESSIAESFWHNMFYGLASDEVSLGAITKDDTVMQIGTGPLPLMAVLYHQNTGCSVTCVEKDITSVETSRAFIETLGLSDNIVVVHSMGQEVDCAGYTHVVVSQHTMAKPEIYAHVRSSVTPEAKVIVRTNAAIGDIFFKNEVEQMLDAASFKVIKRTPLGNKTTAALLVEVV